jgi:CheY-like chemotaxis protein
MKRLSATRSFTRIPRLVAGCMRSLRDKRMPSVMSPNRKRRILLIDDESALTHICRLMLEKTDSFVVREENLGARALTTARDFRPDVIFLDIRLPDKDGHMIAAELTADPVLRGVPIVFWSGSVSGDKPIVANSHGCWPALPKPFSTEALTQFAHDPSYKTSRS